MPCARECGSGGIIILKLDEEQRIAVLLNEQRKCVLAIFADDYLADCFWEDGRSSGSVRHKVPGWYAEGRYCP